MKKGVEWQWGMYQKDAFHQLKLKLCKAPILRYPNSKLPYTVMMDALGAAVGGVWMKDQGEGLQPLGFMNKVLKPSERRYSAYERELAAIAHCFLPWRHYLEGCPSGVTVMTDHQPLLNAHHATSYPFSGSDAVGSAWFLLVNPTYDCVPGRKGEYSSRRIVKEQEGGARCNQQYASSR